MKFDEIPSFSTNSWPKRNFDNISANFRGMYCFERLELSATYSLMALMRLEISSENSFYAANIRGDNSLQLFILSKRFGWICGSVLLYVKLPWNFPQRFESSAWPMLFATMATLSVSIVSMRLDHLRTLLLVVIVAKVSNYSTKKQKSPSTSKASTQLKYRKRWNATGYWVLLSASFESCVSPVSW